MTTKLLATKLHRPTLPKKLVRRPQLVKKLKEGLDEGHCLTLVSAPAGFGKSICVGEWLQDVQRPVAWLSVDSVDNDPERFLEYLIAALQQIDSSLGRGLKSSLSSGQLPSPCDVADSLLSDILDLTIEFILVLDDVHTIQEPSILEVIERLVSACSPQMHLVLVTREDPPLPLARLRVNNQMTEIRIADLRFSASEADQFFEQLGLSLTGEDVRTLETRTEGWAAGLQLAGLSMQGRSDPAAFIASLNGSHRFILGYLVEEVLTRQSEDIQQFLLQTSVLDEMTGDLCDAVTGRTDSAGLLERLYAANMFLIPLDDEQRWYRYHHLFLDLLRSQYTRLYKTGVADLHLSASRWYEQANMPIDAIRHALAAGDYARTVGLLKHHAMHILTQGYAQTLNAWMQSMPPEWRTRSVETNLAFALTHLIRGSYDKMNPYLQQIEAALDSPDGIDTQMEDHEIRAEWLALQSNLLNVRGKSAESIQKANQALRNLPEENHFIRSMAYLGLGGAYRLINDYPRMVEAYQHAIQDSRTADNLLSEMLAVSALALSSVQYGHLHFAAELSSAALSRFDSSQNPAPPCTGIVYGCLGMVSYEWNQLEQARDLTERAYRLSTQVGHNAGRVYTQVYLARLNLAEHDLEGAAKTLRAATDLLPLGTPAWLTPEVISEQVRIELVLGHPEAARLALEQSGFSLQKGPFAITNPDPLCIAWLRLFFHQILQNPSQVDPAPTLDLVEQWITSIRADQRNGILLQLLLLRAQILAATGDLKAGLADLSEVIRLSEPEGYTRIFVDEGAPVAALLRRLSDSPSSSDYIHRLLAAFPDLPEASSDLPRQTALVEPLTERELEVLKLIAEGLKYEEIAGRLIITVNTVRFYVKSIYGKLAVNNRTRAIETARSLGLI